jgi:hypothetical protein
MWRLSPEPITATPLPEEADHATLGRTQGVRVSDCMHCDIREMLETHLQSGLADFMD